MQSDATAIEHTILALAKPPARELAAFIREGRPLRVARGEPFCAPGDTVHQLGFLHRGLLRYHVLAEDGTEVTKDFALPGTFCAAFGSALQGVSAAVALTAVEDAELTVWPWQRARELLEQHVEWQRFGSRVAELLYLRKERRELELLRLSAAERYAAAQVELGAAFARIPRHQLASYLGIAPESLSRLRRRLLTSKRSR